MTQPSRKRQRAGPTDLDFLKVGSARRQAKDLAERKLHALDKTMRAGEAFAHGEPAIGAQLMKLAEYFMEGALEAAVRHYAERERVKQYRQAQNPGGRPRKADLGAAWLTEFELARKRRRGATAWEIYGDIAQAHKDKTGTAYTTTYVSKATSIARTTRAQAVKKGTFR